LSVSFRFMTNIIEVGQITQGHKSG